MAEHELPSDSDSSDEDFVPEGVDSDLPSEDESSPDDAELNTGELSDDEPKEKTSKSKKRSLRKKGGTKKKRVKKALSEGEEHKAEEKQDKVKEKPVICEEEEKKKADSLWADFMKDVGGRPARKSAVGSISKVDNSDEKVTAKATLCKPAGMPSTEKENKVTITKLFEFAGEEVRVTQEVQADSAEARLLQLSSDGAGPTSKSSEAAQGRGQGKTRGGLSGISSVLSQIGKKAKISTLEKSKLDWERYKDEQGIQEEIQTHNRGKDGYLEKQDFLQRTDLRQFEIEKQMRASRRSNR